MSIEPFLDYDPIKLIETINPLITESIWIGRMNYIHRNNLSSKEKIFYFKIRRNYETCHLWEVYNMSKNFRLIKFKDSIRNQLGINYKETDVCI